MTGLAWPSTAMKEAYYAWLWNPNFVGPPNPLTSRALEFIDRVRGELDREHAAFFTTHNTLITEEKQ